WCIFEIAAFLHSRSPGCKADLQIVPPLLGPALLGCEVLFGISLFIYSYIESALSASEDGILVGEVYVVVSSVHVLLFVSLVTHALRGYGRNIDTLQGQLRGFKVEHARSACCDGGHRSSSARLTCDRKVIHTCISAWFSSLDSFERQVQTDVRLAIIDQLAYQAVSYQRIVLLSTPYVWLRFHYAASHADDPIRQVVDMAQTFTYLLAIFPLVDKLGVRLCYRWRARCCWLYLDFVLSVAIVIVGLSFYIACYTIQLYVFRQNDRGLLLSVISMLSWWTVVAILRSLQEVTSAMAQSSETVLGKPAAIAVEVMPAALTRCKSNFVISRSSMPEALAATTAVIDQLAYKTFSYQRALQVFTPYVWIRLGYTASNADDPSRQVVDLVQTLAYFLAIIPMSDKLAFDLCYRWRARCCKPYLDFLLSLAVLIVGLSFYIAC
ncbi:unnamed protein product, partial [Symbiodinium sp. CCMP2456]